jgi:hypothetical protein
MAESLRDRADRLFETLISLPRDVHGGVRIPADMRQQWIDLCLDVMNEYGERERDSTKTMLRILTKKSA